MGRATGTFRIVSLGSPFLMPLTDHDRGVKVKRIVVEFQFGEEPSEQLAEHTLVDGQ